MNEHIRFGEPFELTLPVEKLPPEHLLVSDQESRWQRSQPFQLYIVKSVLDQIWKHVEENPRVESGGVLVGHPFRNLEEPAVTFVVIAKAIRQDSDNRSVGHFTVGPHEIAAARAEIEEYYPGLVSVGWYHSHPGHGVFLSGLDLQIVRSIYNADWHVSLVLDPQRKEVAFFRGPDGMKVPGWLVLKENSATQPSGAPVGIRAIALFNQWQQAQESGEDRRAKRLLRQLEGLILSEAELQHWQEMGEYQNIALSEKEICPRKSAVENLAIPKDNGENESNASIVDHPQDKIYRQALRHFEDENYDAAISHLRILKDKYRTYRPEDVESLLTLSKQRQNNTKRRGW